jgi:hypothetical protein
MLSKISLENRLRDISDLIDKGYATKIPGRIESEYRELRDLGYSNPEQMVADWRARNNKTN